MAAARGRKRTDDTTPNRARDIQRAFRARRAAHLDSLEERILELEDENNYFRALLNLPVSNRPPLGKGPTGRGVAKSRARSTVQTQANIKSVSSSPTPPSDSPTTPTMELPVPHHPPHPDAYSLDMPRDPESEDAFPYPPPDEKVDHALGLDQYSYPIPRHSSISEGMLPIHPDYDRVGLNQSIPSIDTGLGQGLINDYVWGGVGVPHVTVNGDLPTPTTQRAFSYTQQIAPPSMPRANTPVHLRPPQGHRRSNTEPHSLGSLVAAYTPAHHRSSSSDVGGYGTPSPPPLISRGGYSVY